MQCHVMCNGMYTKIAVDLVIERETIFQKDIRLLCPRIKWNVAAIAMVYVAVSKK